MTFQTAWLNPVRKQDLACSAACGCSSGCSVSGIRPWFAGCRRTFLSQVILILWLRSLHLRNPCHTPCRPATNRSRSPAIVPHPSLSSNDAAANLPLPGGQGVYLVAVQGGLLTGQALGGGFLTHVMAFLPFLLHRCPEFHKQQLRQHRMPPVSGQKLISMPSRGGARS